MLVITTAMKQEADSVRRCLKGLREVSGPGYRAWRGNRNGADVLSVETGMGKEAARTAMRAVLEKNRAEAIVSIGFGGALTPDLQPGHIILCSTTLHHQHQSAPSHYTADEKLLQAAAQSLQSSRNGWNTGSGVTVLKIADHEMKEQLRTRFGAAVCEMEDAWLAGEAREYGTPFLAVRVIMDEFRDEMDPYLEMGWMLDADGKINLRAVLSSLTTRPDRIKALFSAFRAYRKARAGIEHFVTLFLDNGLPCIRGA